MPYRLQFEQWRQLSAWQELIWYLTKKLPQAVHIFVLHYGFTMSKEDHEIKQIPFNDMVPTEKKNLNF